MYNDSLRSLAVHLLNQGALFLLGFISALTQQHHEVDFPADRPSKSPGLDLFLPSCFLVCLKPRSYLFHKDVVRKSGVCYGVFHFRINFIFQGKI